MAVDAAGGEPTLARPARASFARVVVVVGPVVVVTGRAVVEVPGPVVVVADEVVLVDGWVVLVERPVVVVGGCVVVVTTGVVVVATVGVVARGPLAPATPPGDAQALTGMAMRLTATRASAAAARPQPLVQGRSAVATSPVVLISVRHFDHCPWPLYQTDARTLPRELALPIFPQHYWKIRKRR
jgi:hypothetical protein